MSVDDIARRLVELLSYFSGAPQESLGSASSPQNTQGWDSAANLNFIAAIEDEFAVTIATRDVTKLRSLGDFAAYLAARETRETREPTEVAK
jgi:acyl carrier protein